MTPPEATDTGATESPGRLGRLLHRRRGLSEDQFDRRFSAQFAQHLTQLRNERRLAHPAPAEPSIHPGQSNFRRAEVPYGVDLAAAWSWRFIVIVIAGAFVVKAIGFLSLVVMPVVVALFLAALLVPVVNFFEKGLPRGPATLLVVLGLLGSIALMLTFAGTQVAQGANDLSGQVVDGLEQVRTWLKEGPLNASQDQIDNAIQQAQDAVTTSNAEIVKRVTEVSTAVGHVVAGFFIVLFATYFFLSDGNNIWAWVVRLFPRAARARADGSGRVAWLSLTQFVRATVLVALVDAIGIAVAAAILRVPFVAAIGVLVFLGAFVPVVGATVSGVVAILVALVAQGPIVALIMLGAVIAIQQLEAHVLQPFLLGRMVRVHPLAVILAVASGVFLAGIPGALVAVPLVASLNAVAVYLADDPEEAEDLDEDLDNPVTPEQPVGDDPGEVPGPPVHEVDGDSAAGSPSLQKQTGSSVADGKGAP